MCGFFVTGPPLRPNAFGCREHERADTIRLQPMEFQFRPNTDRLQTHQMTGVVDGGDADKAIFTKLKTSDAAICSRNPNWL